MPKEVAALRVFVDLDKESFYPRETLAQIILVNLKSQFSFLKKISTSYNNECLFINVTSSSFIFSDIYHKCHCTRLNMIQFG